MLAANEGRSWVDSVNVRTGEHLDRLRLLEPCCIERIPGEKGQPVRVLVSGIADRTVHVLEVSPEGKLRSLGKVNVGKAPKRVAFLPASAP